MNSDNNGYSYGWCEQASQSLKQLEDEVKIDRKEVEHVAELARLQFDESQLEKFINQMNAILEYFDTLQDLDTRGIEPTSHAVVMNNVFRDDEEEKRFHKNRMLENAPAKEKGCFKVPKVIE